jgi:DNA-binding NarL/FixJ family response regulator
LLTGNRCLVLDDEFLIALDIQQILELAGAKHVASVATASEAIALVRREAKFDLAVLDVKLGGSEDNSLGVASELAKTLWRFSTPCNVPSKTRRDKNRRGTSSGRLTPAKLRAVPSDFSSESPCAG